MESSSHGSSATLGRRSTKYVVLDRDGTLIRHIPYLYEPRAVELLPTVVEGIALLRAAGCQLFVHTNQSGVGRGWFGLADVEACNREVLAQLGMGDDVFARWCIATEGPDAVAEYRKPSPAFGRELMRAYDVDRRSLWYIGDNVSDLGTADTLGCHGIGVDTGGHSLRITVPTAGFRSEMPIVNSFLEAALLVVSAEV